MENGILYKSVDDDIMYRNNVGEVYMLTEAVNPLGSGTYDIVVAFKVTDDDNDEFYDMKASPIWFAGAWDLQSYWKGQESYILDACHDFLDKQ